MAWKTNPLPSLCWEWALHEPWTMMSGQSFLIFCLLLLGGVQDALAGPGVDFSRILFPDGKFYTVAFVVPEAIDYAVTNPELAALIAGRAKKWAYDEYKARYPQIPAEFFDKMAAKDNPLDGRSSFVVIFKGEDFNQIQATIRVAYRTLKNPDLPLELDLGWSFPHKPMQESDSQLEYFPFYEGQEYSTSYMPLVGTDEIKTFVMSRNAEHDFVPYLHFFVEWDRLMHRASATKNLSANGFGPREYALYCDKLMVPYYEKLGFHLVTEQPIRGNYIMTMDRNDFIRVGSRLKKRPGGRLFHDSRLVPSGIDFPFDRHLSIFELTQRLGMDLSCQERLRLASQLTI